ncbi:iron-containing alcohol dehydrogenase, partial [bacterium]|nr:iron-containing alcohol dehydrogenase [bacterium]
MNIYSLLNKAFTCQFCGKQHFSPIKEVVTKKGAILSLPDFFSYLVKGKEVLILSDNVTYEVAGKRCAELLSGEYKTSSLILSPKGAETVHAEEKYLPEIFEHLQNKNAILTVGTGSITDLGKYVADELNVPVVSFPTAPSMNAYTSEISALLLKGVKVTLSVRPAVGVLTDLDIISQAPLDLIKAGFADSLAKAFANADWKMSSLLTGEDFCPLPLKITTEAESKYIDRGDELIQRKEEIISYLMDGLNAGGFSMVIAGETSPASGGEHLISHFLDMV